MVGISEEYDSQVHLVIEGYLELQTKNPEHELLSLVTIHQDKRGFDHVPDFNKRCLPANFNGEHPDLFAIGYYYIAMCNAVRGLPFELPAKPKPRETSEAILYGSLDELFS